MIADIPKLFTSTASIRGAVLQPADHNTVPSAQCPAAGTHFADSRVPMKRQLVFGTLLMATCVALSICLIATSGCNTLANLHVINPSYQLRSVNPHLNLGIPPSMDLEFTVNVNNPNPVALTLNYFDFDVLVNNNPILRNVHSVQGFRIRAQGDNDVHLATHVTYDSIRSIYT